ncbi:MAG: 3-deoxy-8-phosphooctulonate synthase [bacterium]
MVTRKIHIGNVQIGGEKAPLVLIAGPCVIESEIHTLHIARLLKSMTEELSVPFIFKASFDKANRSSRSSFRGPGLLQGLKILHKVRQELEIPVLSDVHEVGQVEEAAKVLDIIQIPAFLCRQTDLLMAAAATKKPVNVKKGQFLSPWEAKNFIDKVCSGGNEDLIITERGTSFGYNNLVVDMRALPIMRGFGYPVVFDATHSVQLPGKEGGCSSGEREYIPFLARAAIAAGCDAIFMEVHDRPDQAKCDGPNMVSLEALASLLPVLKKIDTCMKSEPSLRAGMDNP